jgi:hypothetical protein
MDLIIKEIENAIKNGFYYISISTCLTLPSICMCLESDSGDTKGKDRTLYIEWFDLYFKKKYQMLTGNDLYILRNGVIHNGRFGHDNMSFSRILFTIPTPDKNYFHKNILNDALNVDAITFCNDIVCSVREWESKNIENANVKRNLPRLVEFRPNGLAPYMVGVPLIS